MSSLTEAVHDFLAQKRIAVVGVSRQPNRAANHVFKKLQRPGFEVFAVNPRATEVGGNTCYPDLKSIPGGVGAVVIATPPLAAESVVRECIELGISRVWFHRSFGSGSFSERAVQVGREAGMSVIPGGCPMMFCAPVDVAHKCFRWFLDLTGKLPKTIPAATP
jgi:predicted CoA-binding protein